jgi:hypothetical protein
LNTCEILAEGLNLIGSKFIGELGLLDNSPSFQRSEGCFGEVVGEGTCGEQLSEFALVCPLCKIVGIAE